jgi:3-phenylpropionate/cinnamic acid dioxygenase small subunit
VQGEVERLYAYEAYLLDERRFDEWVGLFTEDAVYSLAVREVVQSRDEEPTPLREALPTLIAEGPAFLTMRVRRLDTHLAHAEQPPSLTRHLITNVLVHEASSDETRTSSNFQVYQARIDISAHTFFGKREDTLRKVGGQWRIAQRQVVLDTSLLPRTLTIFF